MKYIGRRLDNKDSLQVNCCYTPAMKKIMLRIHKELHWRYLLAGHLLYIFHGLSSTSYLFYHLTFFLWAYLQNFVYLYRFVHFGNKVPNLFTLIAVIPDWSSLVSFLFTRCPRVLQFLDCFVDGFFYAWVSHN